MERLASTPEDYFATLDAAERAGLEKLDEMITAAMPHRRRSVWSGVFWGGTEQTIVGYGDIVQPRPKGRTIEWFLVGIARQKHGFSVYVNAAEDGHYLGKRFGSRLGRVKLGSASIGFAHPADLDTEVFAAMLRRADELTPPDERQ